MRFAWVRLEKVWYVTYVVKVCDEVNSLYRKYFVGNDIYWKEHFSKITKKRKCKKIPLLSFVYKIFLKKFDSIHVSIGSAMGAAFFFVCQGLKIENFFVKSS